MARVRNRLNGVWYEVDTPKSGSWSIGHDPVTGEPVFKGIPPENIRVVEPRRDD